MPDGLGAIQSVNDAAGILPLRLARSRFLAIGKQQRNQYHC